MEINLNPAANAISGVKASVSLTTEQETAVFLHHQPVFLTAGAGSGKTSVLVRRYIALLSRGLKPKEILAVTFTNEAADELKTRIIRELEPGPLKEDVENTPNIGTIHSFCYQIVSGYGSLIGLQSIKGIVSRFQFAEYFESAYQTWFKEQNPSTLESLLNRYTVSEIRDLGRSAFFQRHHISNNTDSIVTEILSPFQTLCARLEKTLFDDGMLTFDDLETLSLKLLKTQPLIRGKLQDQFKAMLIDEFQDTSRNQWEILEHCLGDDPTKLFLVGDPKQSIYSFRHAEVALFHEVKKTYHDGAQLELKANFRTTRTLLNSINTLSPRLFESGPVSFVPMEPARQDSELSTAAKLTVLSYASADDYTRAEVQAKELEAITAHIKKLCDSGIQPKDITLLFRNGDRIVVYEEALHSLGLPTFCQRSVPLFQTYAVTDLIAFLKCVLNPYDDLTLASLLSQMQFSFQELWDLRTQVPKTDNLTYPPLFESLSSLPKMHWFIELIESGESRVAELITIYFRNVKPGLENLGALLALFEPLSAPQLTVFDLAPKLTAWKYQEMNISTESGDRSKGIRLMTVHAAKGLEFPHVILADNLRQPPRRQPLLQCRPGMGTGIKYRENDEWVESKSYARLKEVQAALDQEEAGRILYVAITRARDSLTLVLPDNESAPKGSWADILMK